MSRSWARDLRLSCLLSLATALTLALAAPPPPCPACPRLGDDRMLEPHTASLLVDYFEAFLRDKDLEAFHRNVLARYTEGTLARLASSGDLQAKRAAVLALGLVGSFEVNQAVARGLRDPDAAVRNLSQNALWAIWFRAGTPEHNARLQEVRDLIGRERFAEARDLAARLIADAPGFAEAYNQRAIAFFSMEDYAQSAAECRRALERNPYHFGALGGLGQCYLKLGRNRDALQTFRRALTLQPFSAGLRQTVEMLEAEGE